MEAPGERLGAGAVVAGPAGLVPAGGGGGQDPGAGAAGVLAGPGDGQADGQVWAAGRGTGQAGGGGDGGLQRPADLPQWLALVVLAFAVVSLADVPAAVGVAGAQPGPPGRAAGEQRHRGGVQAGAAADGGAFVLVQDRHAGLEQRVEERFEPGAGGLGLGGGHRLGAAGEFFCGEPAVLRQRRGIHDRADGAEAVADPAAGGQEAAAAGGGAGDPEQRPGNIADLVIQQPGGLGQEQRPVIERQAQQRGEHGAHRQRAGPPGAVGQRGLDDRGLAGAVNQPGGEGHRPVADAAACRRQGQAGAAHRVSSARQRSRRTPLDELMPATWRA